MRKSQTKRADRKPVRSKAGVRVPHLIGKRHLFTNAWDNFAMGGSGATDVWMFKRKYFVASDGINYNDDDPSPEDLALMEGPFDDIATIFSKNVGNVLSIGSSSQYVSSRLHSVDMLRKLITVEKCLFEEEDERKDLSIEINGVRHRIDPKTLEIQAVEKRGKVRDE